MFLSQETTTAKIVPNPIPLLIAVLLTPLVPKFWLTHSKENISERINISLSLFINFSIHHEAVYLLIVIWISEEPAVDCFLIDCLNIHLLIIKDLLSRKRKKHLLLMSK